MKAGEAKQKDIPYWRQNLYPQPMKSTENHVSQSSMRILTKLQLLILTVFSIGGSILWTWYAGKDINWDAQNYHFYVAYQWAENRLSKDFMAASLQSYFNPIGYLPFYWMVRANFHSFLIGAILAAIHSINLLLVAVITSSLLPPATRRRFMWIVLSVLVAAINPVFATELGNTFIDITTSIFVLAGYALCFHWLAHVRDSPGNALPGNRPELKTWMAAGLCLGLACGFKLTNMLYAIALWPAVVAVRASARDYLCRTFAYAAAGIIGFIVVDGYWAWSLFKEFGNPLFPLSNTFFKSPDFPLVDLVDTRFIPESISEALLLPIHALAAEQNVYTEWWSPDSRLLVLFIAVLGYALKLGWKRYADAIRPKAAAKPDVLTWALIVWVVAYAIWLYMSGNGRYFVAGLLLLGPFIVALLVRLTSGHRFTVYALVMLIIWQIGLEAASQQRWTPTPWTDNWFEVRPSLALTEQPYLYLTPTVQTSMYLAPFLHKGSAFSNIAGQVTIAKDGAGSKRVESLIGRYEGNIRSLFTLTMFNKDASSYETIARTYDGIYERFGLQTDPGSCEMIDVMKYDIVSSGSGLSNAWGLAKHSNFFSPGAISCRLVPHTGPSVLKSELARRIDYVFDRIEQVCPQRFSPAPAATKKFPKSWARSYFNSVVTLVYFPGYDKLEYQVLGSGTVYLGRLIDWEQKELPPHDCSVKKGQMIDYGPLSARLNSATTGKPASSAKAD